MKIYDTLSAQKTDFTPDSDEVKMYVCGVTPYDSCHIGHAMSYIIFDVVRRYLKFRGYKVKYVQNFTDIDDKIIARANEHGIPAGEMAERFINEYFENNNPDFAQSQAGKFIRYATAADISEERHLWKIAKEEMESCKRFVKEMDLPMKIVDAEHVFGGERIIFYFMSDGRVDFRELVKRIAQEYQTRIEMRQIGSRDEAKLLGDGESCGQQCCCQRFLKHLKPVNMRMAKMQKATLDPAKISGYCGRLKCCLRYEDKTYTELKKQLPKKNSRVKTRQGVGKVVDTQILTQLVMIEYESGERSAVGVEEIKILPPAAAKDEKLNGAPNKKKQNNNP